MRGEIVEINRVPVPPDGAIGVPPEIQEMVYGNSWRLVSPPVTRDNLAESRFVDTCKPPKGAQEQKRPAPSGNLTGYVIREEIRGKGGLVLGVQYRVSGEVEALSGYDTILAPCTVIGNPVLADGSSVDVAIKRDLLEMVKKHGTSVMADEFTRDDAEGLITKRSYSRRSDVVWLNAVAVSDVRSGLAISKKHENAGKSIVLGAACLAPDSRTFAATMGFALYPAGDYYHMVEDAKAALAWIRKEEKRTSAGAKDERSRRRFTKLLAQARKGKIPAYALKAGLHAAYSSMHTALSWHQNSRWYFHGNRTSKNSEILLSIVKGKTPKRFVDGAWKTIRGWKGMSRDKFDEMRELCSAASGKGNAETKLACKMWAQSGRYE